MQTSCPDHNSPHRPWIRSYVWPPNTVQIARLPNGTKRILSISSYPIACPTGPSISYTFHPIQLPAQRDQPYPIHFSERTVGHEEKSSFSVPSSSMMLSTAKKSPSAASPASDDESADGPTSRIVIRLLWAVGKKENIAAADEVAAGVSSSWDGVPHKSRQKAAEKPSTPPHAGADFLFTRFQTGACSNFLWQVALASACP
jgi:hypothetical protein